MGQNSYNAGQRHGAKGTYKPDGYNRDDYDSGYSKARGERHGNQNRYDNSHRHSQNKKSYDNGWKGGYRNYKSKNNTVCFIATACYGKNNSPEVLILRQFRDEHLLTSFSGRLFVRFYYFVSPTLANLISRSVFLKKLIRKSILNPIVDRIQISKSKTGNHSIRTGF